MNSPRFSFSKKKVFKNISIVFFTTLTLWYFFEFHFHKATKYGVYKVNKNYDTRLREILTDQSQINYFKALILLECSASKTPPNRFEAGTYAKLLKVQKGDLPYHGGTTRKILATMNTSQIKDLATSWGPMQLMGYHSIKGNFTIDDLKGKKALAVSIAWCLKEYGHLLKSDRFDDAFHYHNTGRIFPRMNILARTFDPNYVRTGKAYMRMLEKNDFLKEQSLAKQQKKQPL